MNKILGLGKNLGLILSGTLLIAFSVNTTFIPFVIPAGGVTGLAIIAKQAFGISESLTVLVLNMFLLIAALMFIGKKFFLKSIVGSLALPIYMNVLPVFELTTDKFMALFAGTIILSIGVKLVYMAEASTGGTTIPPVILNKYFGYAKSKGLFISDGVVVLTTLFVIGLQEFIVAAVGIILFAIIYEYIETGISMSKSVHIISEKHEEIKDFVMNELGRGATYLNGTGAYQLQEKNILVVVVKTNQLQRLKKKCNELDENAFIIIHSVSDVHGSGFSYTR